MCIWASIPTSAAWTRASLSRTGEWGLQPRASHIVLGSGQHHYIAEWGQRRRGEGNAYQITFPLVMLEKWLKEKMGRNSQHEVWGWSASFGSCVSAVYGKMEARLISNWWCCELSCIRCHLILAHPHRARMASPLCIGFRILLMSMAADLALGKCRAAENWNPRVGIKYNLHPSRSSQLMKCIIIIPGLGGDQAQGKSWEQFRWILSFILCSWWNYLSWKMFLLMEEGGSDRAVETKSYWVAASSIQ